MAGTTATAPCQPYKHQKPQQQCLSHSPQILATAPQAAKLTEHAAVIQLLLALQGTSSSAAPLPPGLPSLGSRPLNHVITTAASEAYRQTHGSLPLDMQAPLTHASPKSGSSTANTQEGFVSHNTPKQQQQHQQQQHYHHQQQQQELMPGALDACLPGGAGALDAFVPPAAPEEGFGRVGVISTWVPAAGVAINLLQQQHQQGWDLDSCRLAGQGGHYEGCSSRQEQHQPFGESILAGIDDLMQQAGDPAKYTWDGVLGGFPCGGTSAAGTATAAGAIRMSGAPLPTATGAWGAMLKEGNQAEQRSLCLMHSDVALGRGSISDQQGKLLKALPARNARWGMSVLGSTDQPLSGGFSSYRNSSRGAGEASTAAGAVAAASREFQQLSWLCCMAAQGYCWALEKLRAYLASASAGQHPATSQQLRAVCNLAEMRLRLQALMLHGQSKRPPMEDHRHKQQQQAQEAEAGKAGGQQEVEVDDVMSCEDAVLQAFWAAIEEFIAKQDAAVQQLHAACASSRACNSSSSSSRNAGSSLSELVAGLNAIGDDLLQLATLCKCVPCFEHTASAGAAAVSSGVLTWPPELARWAAYWGWFPSQWQVEGCPTGVQMLDALYAGVFLCNC